ncbi:MAG: radical SAM protein [Syntrophobacterales bacterium]|nr:MAG: radical SAM protein [Syntrophobacterales bacterium]
MRTSANPYSRIVKKTLDKLIPFTVHWELTYHCNLQCPHCYAVPQKSREELSSGEIAAILDLLKESGTLYVIFSGGEILTRGDFFDIARYARSKGFALRLMSNGTLIHESVADRIKDLRPLSVEISLYGSNPQIHDGITGCPGSFERSLKALRLLRERSIRTVVKSLMMKGNVGDFQGMRKLARGMGSQFLYDPVVIPKMNGSMEPCGNRLDREELYTLLYPEVRDTVEDEHSGAYDLSCSAGLNAVSISPYGDVYPCMGFKESGGNLTKNSLPEIYHSPIFSKIRSITLSELRECRGCQLIPYCNRCPALALMETGDLLGPSHADCLLAGVIKSVIDAKRERPVTEDCSR